MYKIKQQPEDFVVNEITAVEPKESGRFVYFWLKKTNYTTLRAVQHIADALHIPVKRIGFAGNKDKVAVTKQLISIDNVKKEKVESLGLKDIELSFFGYGDDYLGLGDLKGNDFRITIRNLDENDKINSKVRVLNLFGEQRFSKQNHLIGKAIVKKDFKKAVEMLLESEGDIEEHVRDAIRKNSSDYVGALRKVPKKMLRMYVHAYQSHLWNECVKEYKGNADKFPIIGFGTEVDDEIIKILDKENITPRDFIIRQIPELSAEGDERSIYTDVRDFKVLETGDDELGKKKAIVSFSLPKGSYATVVIDALFS